MNAFVTLVARDLRLVFRQGWHAPTTLLFFVLVIVLLAFGIGPDPALLRAAAPGAVWVAALLSALLSLDRIFAADAEDGSLDILLVAPIPAELLALAKMTSHWLTTGLPLALISPLGGLLLAMPPAAIWITLVSLLIGTPVLSLVGGAVAALMVGARRGGVLIALLVLPLYIPLLIFGAGTIQKALAGGTLGTILDGPLAFIAALLAVALPLAPIAAAAALEE